jgi:hypothetical protein
LQVLVFLCFLLFSMTAFAETLTCPWGRVDAILKGGPPEYFGGIPPDMGGDYDDNALQYEWNNLTAYDVTPAIVHCVSKADPQKIADINIPPGINRCILRQGEFVCRSGTVSFSGYVDSVEIEGVEARGISYKIDPTSSAGVNQNGLVWKNLDQNRKGIKLIARCIEKSLPKEIMLMEIPISMKECSLINRRFRCTDTPDQYDLFWPKG